MRLSRNVTMLLLLPCLLPGVARGQAAALQRARDTDALVQKATRVRQADADAAYAEGADQPAPVAKAHGAAAGPIDLDAAGAQAAEVDAQPAEAGDRESIRVGARGAASAPERYTVQKGDTLWDLSRRFLDDPWTWPKVWAKNPAIANPHFIYPGNTLSFGGGEEAQAAQGPRELEDFSRSDGRPIGEDDDVAVVGPYKIGYVAPRGTFARRDSFVTQHELDESGVLHAAFDEKSLLSTQDRVYVRFKAPAQVKVDERYLFYRTERPLVHPATGLFFGYQTTILGSGRVVAVDDRAATVEIVQALDCIERGALLGPFTGKLVKQVQRRPNTKDLDGTILAAQQEVLTELGQHHVVFLDRGRRDGVEEGNTFEVVRSGDLLNRDMDEAPHDPTLPVESVGTLLVVDVQETAATALVLRSDRELFVGDEVRMRPAAGPKVSAR